MRKRGALVEAEVEATEEETGEAQVIEVGAGALTKEIKRKLKGRDLQLRIKRAEAGQMNEPGST